MSDDIKAFEAAMARVMGNIDYIKMLLGVAISRLPDSSLEVARDDYEKLVGLGLVLVAGEKPNTFRLVLKPLPKEDMSGIPVVGVVGDA